MHAEYVLAATVRFAPEHGSVEPERVEVRYRHPAPEPGEPGWLFFRDRCWRGELNDERGVRRLLAEALDVDGSDGVAIERVELRGFETDDEYLEALKDEIAADLETFKADSTTEVLHKYLGSRLEVESE